MAIAKRFKIVTTRSGLLPGQRVKDLDASVAYV